MYSIAYAVDTQCINYLEYRYVYIHQHGDVTAAATRSSWLTVTSCLWAVAGLVHPAHHRRVLGHAPGRRSAAEHAHSRASSPPAAWTWRHRRRSRCARWRRLPVATCSRRHKTTAKMTTTHNKHSRSIHKYVNQPAFRENLQKIMHVTVSACNARFYSRHVN